MNRIITILACLAFAACTSQKPAQLVDRMTHDPNYTNTEIIVVNDGSKDDGATWSAPAPNRLFSSADAPLLMKDVGPFTVAVFCPMPRFTTRNENRTWNRQIMRPLSISALKNGVFPVFFTSYPFQIFLYHKMIRLPNY